jgi:hypothetical protein
MPAIENVNSLKKPYLVAPADLGGFPNSTVAWRKPHPLKQTSKELILFADGSLEDVTYLSSAAASPHKR